MCDEWAVWCKCHWKAFSRNNAGVSMWSAKQQCIKQHWVVVTAAYILNEWIFSVLCHTAGPWQPNSPSLPILGHSLQVAIPFLLKQIGNRHVLTGTSWPPFFTLKPQSFLSPSSLITCPIKFFCTQTNCLKHFLTHSLTHTLTLSQLLRSFSLHYYMYRPDHRLHNRFLHLLSHPW